MFNSAAGQIAIGFGWQEGLIILVVLLLLFGGRKLPELAKGLARGLKTFKKELNDVKEGLESEDAEKTTDEKNTTSDAQSSTEPPKQD